MSSAENAEKVREIAKQEGWKAPVKNTSGFRPRGHAILTLPTKIYNGPIALPDSVKERFQALEDVVTVIEVGKACWIDEPEPRAKAGEQVMITKFAGRLIQGQDGKAYRVINDRDIFGVTEVKDNG